MNIRLLKRRTLAGFISGALVFVAMVAQAKISEPDFILYGNPSNFGVPASPGESISMVIAGEAKPLVEYTMGSDTTLGSFYALRVPMDSVEPRAGGTARTGEQVALYINGVVAANTRIGLHGTAVRLDIDPNNLNGGGPGISVVDASRIEGDNGTTSLVMEVTLTTNTDQMVSVDWATSDTGDSAVGGDACAPGIDYIKASGTVAVPAGDTKGSLNVDICGDTDDEANELFQITLSNPVNGYIADGSGFGSILDDDARLTLSINDIQIIEPESGSEDAVFTVSLSPVWNTDVDVNYSVHQGTATAGEDFISSGIGKVTIPAGSLNATISVPVLADGEFEPNEFFEVELDPLVEANLANATGTATIIDPAFEPTLKIVQNEPMASSGPSSVAVSPDGKHVLVGGIIDGSVSVYRHLPGTGNLNLVASYTSATPGFESMKLDGVTDVLVADDGAFVYATAQHDNAVNVFSRDADTGKLEPVEAVQEPTLLNGAAALALSPDNGHLYVIAGTASSIAVYSRDTSTGELDFLQSMTDDTDGVDGLGKASAVVVSEDGRHVYVTGEVDNAFAIFSRDNSPASAEYGRLTYLGQAKDSYDGVKGLVGASSVIVSPDGVYLYATGVGSDALSRFKRDPLTGQVTWLDHKKHGDNGVAGLKGPLDVIVSGDGNYVYVASQTDSSLVLFQRNRDYTSPNYAKLRVIQNLINGSNSISSLSSPSDMAMSPNDQYLYVVTADSVLVLQHLVIFRDDFVD